MSSPETLADELSAWQRIALARGVLLSDLLGLQTLGTERATYEKRIARAIRDLEKLGINPQTGKPLPSRDPKPAKKPAKKKGKA